MAKKTGKGFAEIKRKEAATYEKQKDIKPGQLQKARITKRKVGRKRKRGLRKGTPGARISGAKRTKVAISLAKQGITSEVTAEGLTVTRMFKITPVSRVGQPRPTIFAERLPKKSYLRGVSSSWLSSIGYIYDLKRGTFSTISGRFYTIENMDWEDFEGWYYAHSKGTYFNEVIKGKYKNRIKGML